MIETMFGRKSLPVIICVFGCKKDNLSLHETIHGITSVNTPESVALSKRLTAHYLYSSKEQKSVNHYTGEYSKTLNHYLGNERKLHDDNEHEKHYENIESATEKHKAPETFYTYTGIAKSPLENLKKGDNESYLHRFTSSSIHPKRAELFAQKDEKANEELGTPGYKHLLKIEVKKGENAGGYIAHVSKHPYEGEFLHTYEKVVHVHHEPEIDHKNKWVIWHASAK